VEIRERLADALATNSHSTENNCTRETIFSFQHLSMAPQSENETMRPPVPTLTENIVCVCVITQNFSQIGNRRPSYSDFTILPFGAILDKKKWQTVLRVGETHPHPVGTTRYGHHRSLTCRFLDFRKSPPIRNDGAPKSSDVEIRAKIWEFMPPVKYRGGVEEIFMNFSGAQLGPPPMAQKRRASIRPILIHKFEIFKRF